MDFSLSSLAGFDSSDVEETPRKPIYELDQPEPNERVGSFASRLAALTNNSGGSPPAFSHDVIVQGEFNTELEAKRDQLAKRLNILKSEVQYWQDQSELLNPEEDTRSDSDLIKSLLEANNSTIHSYQSNSRKAELSQSSEDIDQYSLLPIPGDMQFAGLFHTLKFLPVVRNKLVARNIVLNELSGYGFGEHRNKLFSFYIKLYTVPSEELVHSFTIQVSPWIKAEVGELLMATQRTRNINQCLYALSRYGNLYAKRRSIFSRLAKKLLVQGMLWKRSDQMTFRKNSHGMQLTFSWPIVAKFSYNADEEDELDYNDDQLDCMDVVVSSSPTVYLHYPDALANLDKTNVLPKYQQIFASLVKIQGVHNAVLMMHKMLE